MPDTSNVLLLYVVIVLFVVVVVCIRNINVPPSSSTNIISKSIQVSDETLTFFVKRTYNAGEAARMLHLIQQKLFVVVRHLSTMNTDEIPVNLRAGIARLVRKHLNHINLRELDAHRSKTVAYNRGKGATIYICLRACRNCDKLAQADRIFLVALHEIAHSAMATYEPQHNGITTHGQEFLQYETFIFNVAEHLKLFRYANVVGSSFCGISIPDTKLKNTMS